MMALNERYPSAWHMLIERLNLFSLCPLGKKRIFLIESGVQVSISILAASK